MLSLPRGLLRPTLLLAVLFFLFFSLPHSLPSLPLLSAPNVDWRSVLPPAPRLPNATDYASFPPPQEDAYDAIREFWKTWAPVIVAAKLKTHEITVPYAAAARAPEQQDGVRTPAPDYLQLEKDAVQKLKKAHRVLTAELEAADEGMGAVFRGQGIVTVGGGEYMGPLLVGLHMLRQHGSLLPVEVWVKDRTEYELDRALCEDVLPALNARCRIISEFYVSGSAELPAVTHYQLKSLAMLFSGFETLLFLDSDSIPLVTAEELLSATPLQKTGLVLWPDFWRATESGVFYEIAGVRKGVLEKLKLPETGCESGQMLVDKSRLWKTLLLAVYYNVYSGWYYPLLSQGALGMGDKETFLAAAIALHASFYRIRTPVSAIGRQLASGWHGTGMLQTHPEDDYFYDATKEMEKSPEQRKKKRVAFAHVNTPKMNAGHLVDEGDLLDTKGKGRKRGKGGRVRLWGREEEVREKLGEDVERQVWRVLVQTGCELAGTVGEWKQRRGLCARLVEHWRGVFA